jgi:hypothetical protein
MTGLPRKVRAPDLAQMKARGERIVMPTAYPTSSEPKPRHAPEQSRAESIAMAGASAEYST